MQCYASFCFGDPRFRSVKGHGIPQRSGNVFTAGNGQRWSAIRREKALRVFSGFEALHFLLSQSCGLMRVFCPIVQYASVGGTPRKAGSHVSPLHSASVYR